MLLSYDAYKSLKKLYWACLEGINYSCLTERWQQIRVVGTDRS